MSTAMWDAFRPPASHRLPTMLDTMAGLGIDVPADVLRQARAALALKQARPVDTRLADHERSVEAAAVAAVRAGKPFDFTAAYVKGLPTPAPGLADAHKAAVNAAHETLFAEHWPTLRALVGEAFADAVADCRRHVGLLDEVDERADRLDIPVEKVQAAREATDRLLAVLDLCREALRIEHPLDNRVPSGSGVIGPQQASIMPANEGDATAKVLAVLRTVAAGPTFSASEVLDQMAEVGRRDAPIGGWRKAPAVA